MDRFRLLVKDIKREKLVVFFGAGLSLWKEYSSWGYPFKWIQGKVEHYYDELVEYFHGFPADAHIQKSLESIGQKIPKDTDRNDFLEWGETLQQIIIELGELYNRSIGGFPFSSFNDACAKAFQAEGDPPTMRTPYAIPAIYYLLYFYIWFERPVKRIGTVFGKNPFGVEKPIPFRMNYLKESRDS